MLRAPCQLLRAGAPVCVARRGYRNYICSEALRQIEARCEVPCLPRRIPEQKVTVIGAGSDIGQIVSLFLKQQSVVKILAMYDDVVERNVLGVATDMAHIDTSTQIHAYQGKAFFKEALWNADVVLICGGCGVTPPCCNILDRELFLYNQSYVRAVAMAVAHFCPHAVLAIQTPPVDCNFSLCKHTLEVFHQYDKRRLFGINSISSMRANQYYAKVVGSDPEDSFVPVVCGTGRCTRVPVLSGLKGFYCVTEKNKDFLYRLVREGDNLVCVVKSNYEQAHLSIGFATARFVTCVMKGLFERPQFIDSALVEQDDVALAFNMPICSCPVTVGPYGIMKYHIPGLNAYEKELFEKSRCDLEDMLELGRCYAVGEEYYLHPAKFCIPQEPPPPCPMYGSEDYYARLIAKKQ